MRPPSRVPFVRAAICGALLLAILAAAVPACAAPPAGAAAGAPPPSIVATVTLTDVYCAGPCCCAHPYAYYANHIYDRGPLGYCRWFRPLVNGQQLTLTLFLAR